MTTERRSEPAPASAFDPGDTTRATIGARRGSLLPWWLLIGGGTLFLLLYTSPWMKVYFYGLYRFKARVFLLDLEMNFGVWWSAAILLLGAGLLYEISATESGGRRRAYAQLAVLMAAMAVDEIGSFHEWLSGIGGWTILAPFGLVAVALLGDSLRRLWRDGHRTTFWLLFAGFLALASVPIQEYAEHHLTTQSWSNLWGRYLEEATELLGFCLILTAAVWRRQGGRLAGGLAAAVPDPLRMPYLLPIVVGGFLIHLVVSQALLLPIGRWDGDPAAVYPFATFLILAWFAFWMPHHRPGQLSRLPEVRGFWAAVGLLFLFCSIGNVQNLWGLVGGVPGLNRKWFQQIFALYCGLVPAAWFIGWSLWRRQHKRLLWLLALPLTLVILYNLVHPARKQLAGGLFAVICALAFLRPPDEAPGQGSSALGGRAGRAVSR